ncbi:hypothetical protein [Salipaludibacillus aurantiacus]|uniref:Uncharacterized protein n=1 Tax=Salipaludibacillus aurantiacus TaxID=1601833 RepID=A0A1H9R7D5_9BACI|nr:hypothetical protein [Salipaludibacillus aurantiacus]SER68517.1 hypothetical protein SAMN05518684_10316 [Salipaludibacillus aurantiacus]
MLQFIGEIFTIFLACFIIGMLPAAKGRSPFPVLMVIAGCISILPLVFGLIIGAAFFFWLPVLLFKILLFIMCFVIILLLFSLHHPSYGYLPYKKHIHLIVIGVFFFLLGMEFAAFGFSAWFLLLLVPLGVAAMIAGFLLMIKLFISFKYVAFIHFLPLILFLLLAVLKLL